MPLRVTDSLSANQYISQVRSSQAQIARAQEQIASGKRINRPSDDPRGAGAVIRMRTDQASLDKFKRNTEIASDMLQTADSAIELYERTLDRARSILTQGASSTTNPSGRNVIAQEVESLRAQMLTLANQTNGDQYLFGGTRQEVPPYDANGVPAAQPSSEQLLQFEPGGTLVATGLVAEDIFSDATGPLFELLDNVAAALRGTGDAAADQNTLLTGLDRLTGFTDQATIARTKIGVGLTRAQSTIEQLDIRYLGLEQSIEQTESADFAESAIQLTQSSQAFQALIQARAATTRTSLLDLLG